MRKILLATGMLGVTLSGCAYDSYSGYGGSDDYYGERDGYYDADYNGGNGYYGDHGYGDRYDTPFRISERGQLDPWLAETREGQQFVRDLLRLGYRNEVDRGDANRANAYFRRWADTDRDYRLTDAEIRIALVHIANGYGRHRY
ncbi:hypothetical protein [Parasphingopyxis marina]|uniref:Lipoprotein n=1 Tax=Parasphingopyxis marina TaxID=2761622 RepID=A0A842HYG3_9SPHN|nr:hypothetical protein [Parasphingopyxis marina]MBC2777875.1 hypothetical protein [Parasphingopyxis marina]